MDTSLIIIGTINTVISMIACPIIASYKGRSVIGWFFGGLFLGLIGLIIVSCLKKELLDNIVSLIKCGLFQMKNSQGIFTE